MLKVTLLIDFWSIDLSLDRPYSHDCQFLMTLQSGKLKCQSGVFQVARWIKHRLSDKLPSKTSDYENPKGHQDIFYILMQHIHQLASIGQQLTLAFNHFRANNTV